MTGFVIRRKTLISMLFIGLTMLGYISYRNLPVELFPNTEFPYLFVRVSSFREVDPRYMESQAVIPIEGAIGTLEGINKIETYINPGSARIYIEYGDRARLKYAFLKLQGKINELRSTIPDDFDMQVIKFDLESISNMLMMLEVRGGGGLDRVRNIVDTKVRSALESIDGISNIEIFGGREKSVEIVLNDETCKAYGVTVSEVQRLIGQNGRNVVFVGQAYGEDRSYFVNVIAEYTDVRDLENIVLRRDGPVYLKDVADVSVGIKERESISRVNGKEAVTIQLFRDAQANMIDVAHEVRPVIERLNGALSSHDVEIAVQVDTAALMEDNINLIIDLARVGILLAVVVLWFFLRNIKLVVIIAVAVPVSVFASFNFFYAFDIPINILTLIGMALAVGMLLDNSVVVLENIYRKLSQGMVCGRAVTEGTAEVWRAIAASTLTTVIVFLPFIFSSEYLIKMIGRNIGVSIISTLFISLAVALLLIPAAVHFFLQRGGGDIPGQFRTVSRNDRLFQVYTLLLKSGLRFPMRTIIGTIALFFASVAICLLLSTGALREEESDELNLYVTMPAGTTLEAADAAIADLEARLEEIEEKQDVISSINKEDAKLTVKLREDFRKIRNRDIGQVKSDIQERIKDYSAAEVSFEQTRQRSRGRRGRGKGLERMFGIGARTESVILKGSDFEKMRNFAEEIRLHLYDLPSVTSSRFSVAEDRPEIHLLSDTALMERLGVSLAGIGAELRTFSGGITSGLKYKQGAEEYDIVIRRGADESKTVEDLQRLLIPGAGGGGYELRQLSRIVYSFGLSGINRVNQEKQIEISYQFLPEVNESKSLLEAARAEVDRMVADLRIPSGTAVQVEHGENEFREFFFLIAAAIVLIYMILASVFESFVAPVVMMFTIPLAAIGSFWALILTGNSLLVASSLTGFLILLGVVVNNGIIFIDYTRILRGRGFRRSRALMTAGQARVRPILITAITTIVAMFPLAMGKTETAALVGAPFAITVIGGLSISTLFTLVLIPVVYSGVEKALEWLRGLGLWIKVVQLAVFITGCWLIYINIDSLLWRLAGLFGIVNLIPGFTYLVMASLRSARETFIAPGEPITIVVRNLSKVYDHPARFIREWNKGKRISAGAEAAGRNGSGPEYDGFFWQLPLLGFAVFFAYGYLGSSFWFLVLSFSIYFYLFFVLLSIRRFLARGTASRGWPERERTIGIVRRVILWAYPAQSLGFLYLRTRSIALTLFVAIIWYLALVIYTTSERLHRDRVDINRISGRFAFLRRQFYRFVQIIPLLGRRRQPFRALSGVTLEIGHGMFGLLGPNGAGKTTLMRMICGVLDQSYGKIWINGYDTFEKREELQSLIGYLPQEFGTYEGMTAYEFLEYQAMLKNILDREERANRIDYVLGAVHIEEHRDEKIGSFSGGMKQRIGIAQTLLHLPRILVVDEPTAGLDPRERIRFRNLLVDLSRERIVIFSTHVIEDISSSCRLVAVLNRGELRYLDSPVKMTEIARGHVWQFGVPLAEFDDIRKKHFLVHHMRDGDRIRVRCLAEYRPVAYAQPIDPTLEDAYLWLLREDTR